MIRRPAVAAARAARAVRGLCPDRNPLRRTIDRIEAVIAGGLVVAFLAGAPLAAVAGGHAAYELAAVLTPLALGLILLGGGFSVHVMLGRRRLAAWDADWQVTEPHWTAGR